MFGYPASANRLFAASVFRRLPSGSVASRSPRCTDIYVSCCGNILWFEKCNTSEYAAGGHRPTRSDAAKRISILRFWYRKNQDLSIAPRIAFRKHSRQEQRRSAIIELGPGAIPGSFHVFKDGHRSAIDQLIQNTEPNSFAAEPEPGGGNGKPDIRYCGMKFDYRKSADIRVILLIGRSHLVVPTPLPIAPLRSLKI
ncbi:unnamed protein product, partial [Nesidiocoris tenuis]